MIISIEQDRKNFAQKKLSTPEQIGILDALKGKTGIIKEVSEKTKEDIFYMLCFCLCVPQSRADKADEFVKILKQRDFYNTPIEFETLSSLAKPLVRFHNKKSMFLIHARNTFLGPFWLKLKALYQNYLNNKFSTLKEARTYLIKSFKGMSMKSSSHFLRNIGMPGLAILDVHIVNGLLNRGLIKAPVLLTKHGYCDIEKVMISYAEKVGISLEELDLLLWSEGTGYVFK